MFTDKISYTIKHEELEHGKELGRGGFGVVYQGTYRHNDVAIKQLLTEAISADAAAEFEREAKTMAQLRSPNIVQFYGYCVTPNYCIVMEYMPNGSLFSVLRSNKALDWPTRFSIAVDMAKGLSFLHHENILHRDIKSLNVLLDENNKAKLTDFGLSKLKTETRSHLSATKTKMDSVGTLQWMAPELFEDDKVKYTQACDIYSLGVTFWELASRQIPFKNAASPTLVPMWVAKGKREAIPADCPQELASLIQACWAGETNKRPNSDEVVKRLVTASKALTDKAVPAPSAPHYLGNFDSSANNNNNNSNTTANISSASTLSSTGSASSFSLETEKAAIEELLRVGGVNEKIRKMDKAKEVYEQAIVKLEGIAHLPNVEPLFAKAYGVYGEFLLRKGETQAGTEKLDIAESFGFVRTVNSPVVNKPGATTLPVKQAPATPLAFSPQQQPTAVKPVSPTPAKRLPQVNAQALTQFLKMVAEGEQDSAEELLKKNPDLALVPSDVTDLSNRTFKGITGFQYAVWALDWHMWTMIKKYMPDDVIKEQIQGMDTGAWVNKYKKCVNWQNLLDALQKEIELIEASEWTKEATHWQKEVGGAQRLLPAHVVNEYCYPKRAFEPCPNFTVAPLLRTRQTDEGEWFTATYNNGRLGEKFAVVRGDRDKAEEEGRRVRSYWRATSVKQDRQACHRLLETRTQQRDALLAEYTQDNRAGTKLR